MGQDPKTARLGLARRTFLKYSAGAGLLLGAGSLLQAPAWARKPVRPRNSGDVVVENTLTASEEAQSDGPGPMAGAPVNPRAKRDVYRGIGSAGTARYGAP